MPVATKNSKQNVGAARGVAGGYLFWAPSGTPLPTDYSTELDEAFINLGYVNEDGIVFSDEAESEDHTDMNGDTVDSSRTSYTSTMTATLMEYKASTQRVLYGTGNVTDSNGNLTVHNKGEESDHGILVQELLLKSKRKLRKVCPDAQVTEMGELTAVSSEIYAREATFKLYKDDESGDYWTDYAQSTETTQG